ncbi:sugar ABC transporter ATP-binding protein [Microcella alkalica]|uniref:Simple sugar transport system ATP-binding protein/ribose transport system ATP-binding protein n=1 Tax=Microcella alkalica TaxID=355930 RepID=A0A839EDC4_9MICO|nr:sugar ABC transporter ATP-binding protein [Microcella alkalica]MBA8848244.1 simple sugar transport system ATP-binding protein/ribose transport system ATP-binding protein [Microcella alkalica]
MPHTAAAVAPQLLVELRGAGKSFGGVPVLTGIDLRLEPGSVHALVGENGAGKSTLSKIISGVYTIESGRLLIDGEEASFSSPREALDRGIATIAQELALVPELTVAENVFLGREPRTLGFINRRKLRRDYLAIAESTGFELDPDATVGGMRTADQQKVEIMRALARGASLIIMDEPTAALSAHDTVLLHGVVRQLAASGRTVVLISHFLSEVLDLADTITILRDGRLIRTAPASEETDSSLIEGMLGRSLGSVFPDKPDVVSQGEVVLRVTDLVAPGVYGVSFDVRAGEIVGLAGLVGAGRSEIAHAIFGSVAIAAGTVEIEGVETSGSIPGALKSGIFLIPESRKEQGLVLGRPIRDNVTLSNMGQIATGGWVSAGVERRASRSLLDRVTVAGDDRRNVSALSGGNQQKVLFGRALQRSRKLLIADEPTRGVDVGSRRAIYDLIVEQAANGIGVLVISSDVEEVIGLAHRVLVVRGGTIVGEFAGRAMTEENIITAAFADPIMNGSE